MTNPVVMEVIIRFVAMVTVQNGFLLNLQIPSYSYRSELLLIEYFLHVISHDNVYVKLGSVHQCRDANMSYAIKMSEISTK